MSVFWNEKSEAELIRLATGKLTAAQIAAQLGISRNAVIGKLLRGKGKFGRVTDGTARRANKKQTLVARRDAPAQKPVDPIATDVPPVAPLAGAAEDTAAPVFSHKADVVEAPAPVALPVPAPMRFADAVDEGRCLFFAGDRHAPDGPDMLVCGQARAAVPGTRYCAHHISLSVREKVAA